jgi:hypothetical protein
MMMMMMIVDGRSHQDYKNVDLIIANNNTNEISYLFYGRVFPHD